MPPTVIMNVVCQSLVSSFPPVLPARNGIIISDIGIPIGRNNKKTRPEAIVLIAVFRAE
tara:strand:- start:1601 stop:1777 length:177 start_codon:yes stop_codon:yes gene_type:complete